MTTIGERIKSVRLSQPGKMSMDAFADRIGIKKASVSLLESGRNQPSDQTVRSICREFGINETWLRTGEGEMKASVSREQEMAALVANLMSDKPESLRSALITALLRFDPNGDEWKVLERIYENVASIKNESK